MVGVIKANSKVYKTGTPGATLSETLRLDEAKNTLYAVGAPKLKRLRAAVAKRGRHLDTRDTLSDLVEAGDKGGKITLRSARISVVTDSTPESRALLRHALESMKNGPIKCGTRLREGAGMAQASRAPPLANTKGVKRRLLTGKAAGAYRPMNTLRQVSRPAAGKNRGKALASFASALGPLGNGGSTPTTSTPQAAGESTRARSVEGQKGSGTLVRRTLGVAERDRRASDSVLHVTALRGAAVGAIRSDDEELSEPDERGTTSKARDCAERGSVSHLESRGNSSLSSAAASTRIRALKGGWPPMSYASQPTALVARLSNRQGSISRYMTFREPLLRREGFRNMGNTCYVNACLQGLLSLSEFTSDLQRQCWVLAMLKPRAEGAVGGDGKEDLTVQNAIGIPGDTGRNYPATSPATRSQSGSEQATSIGSSQPSLYAALLRLSIEAHGSHGVMDATALKRAIDQHSDRFAGNLQQDAHEFLGDLINVLHEETQPRLDAAAASLGPSKEGWGSSQKRGDGANSNGGRQDDPSMIVDLSADGMARQDGSCPLEAVNMVIENKAALNDAVVKGGRRTRHIQSIDMCSSPLASAKVDVNVECPREGGPLGARASSGDGADGRKFEKRSSATDVCPTGIHGQADKAKNGAGADGKPEKFAAEDRAQLERLMPTTRHFHAEVEVTLTCTRCAYSRRRRELYRDFSLDIPDSEPLGHAYELGALLEQFFKPSELKLRCERCGHDQVRAEHSLAKLPGTLVLHIKRFKAVVSPSAESSKMKEPVRSKSAGLGLTIPEPSSQKEVVDADDASATASADGINVARHTPGESSHSGGTKGIGGSTSGSHSSATRSGAMSDGLFNGISYVKLTAPVTIPKELDLKRFCTQFTANAPADDLGTRLKSLEECGLSGDGITRKSKASGSLTDEFKTGNVRQIEGIGENGRKQRMMSAGVSVDLSVQEGWLDENSFSGKKRTRSHELRSSACSEDPFEFPPPVLAGALSGEDRNTCGSPTSSRSARHAATRRILMHSANRGGYVDTPGERRRRALKNIENRGSGKEDHDRWKEQERQHELFEHRRRSSLSSHANFSGRIGQQNAGVLTPNEYVDKDGHIDYFALMSSKEGIGKQGTIARSVSSAQPIEQRLGPHDDHHHSSSARKALLERDAEETRQMAAAMEASRRDGLPQDAVCEDEDTLLARALQLSRDEASRPSSPSAHPRELKGVKRDDGDIVGAGSTSSGGREGGARSRDDGAGESLSGLSEAVWACGTCTLLNQPSSPACEVCNAAKPSSQLGPSLTPAVSTPSPSGPRDTVSEPEPPATIPAKTPRLEQCIRPPSPQEGSSPLRTLREEPLRARYELRGILHHLGQSAFAGHYVTDVRDRVEKAGSKSPGGQGDMNANAHSAASDRWKRYDDSVVGPVPEAKALDGAAKRTSYICFYSMLPK